MWCNVLLMLLVLGILGVTIANLVETLSSDANNLLRHGQVTEQQQKLVQHHEVQTQAQKQTWEEGMRALQTQLTELHETTTDTARLHLKFMGLTDAPQLETNPATRDRWVASKAAALPAGSWVLDVSSGNQPYRPLFAHCQYRSHEFPGNQEIVDGFRGETEKPLDPHQKYNYVGDITATGAPSDTFDLVILTEVLEHVPEPLLAMQELARVAKPGGRIIVTAPFTSGSHQKPYHFAAGYSREWYHYAAQKYGLEVVDVQSQGDYFKLLVQELNRAMHNPLPDGVSRESVSVLQSTMVAYMSRMSQKYGDGSPNKLEVADDFTIGWMVEFVKTPIGV